MFELINVIFCDYQHGELHMSRKRVILDFPCLFLNARTIEHATGNSNKKPKRETDKKESEGDPRKTVEMATNPIKAETGNFPSVEKSSAGRRRKKTDKRNNTKNHTSLEIDGNLFRSLCGRNRASMNSWLKSGSFASSR